MDVVDAERLIRHFRALSFDPGLRVTHALVRGLPEAPLLLVNFEDETRPGQLGAWWDFNGYEEYVDQPQETTWLASHAKVHLEEIFWAGPPMQARPRDAAGVPWCAMDSLELRLPPSRAS